MPLPQLRTLWSEDQTLTRFQENVKSVVDQLRTAPTIDVGKDVNGNVQFGQAKPSGTSILDGTLVRGVQFQAPQFAPTKATGAGTGTVGFAGTPLKSSTLVVVITTLGAVGTAQFTLSSGGPASKPILTQALYTDPVTGLLLSFSGTFAVNDNFSQQVTVQDVGVSHGLGRAPNGVVSVNPNAPAIIFKSQTQNPHPEQTILLNSTAAVTSDLWIF